MQDPRQSATAEPRRPAFPGPASLAEYRAEAQHYVKGDPARQTLLPLTLTHGRGELVFDADGNEYLDFATGLVVPFGHAFEPIREAVSDACGRLEAAEDYTTPQRRALTDRLASIFPGSLGGVQYYSSGTEAVEAGLRFARATTGNDAFVAFYDSYHGKTLGSMSLATMEPGAGPRAAGFFRAPFDDVAALRNVVEQHCGSHLAGIVLEPIQGDAGVRIPSPGFLGAVEEVCRERGALLVADETLTGMGRTGTVFAFEQAGIRPDIVVLGKGLANGIPISAVVVDARHRESVWHVEGGTTYGGNPVSCAAATVALDALVDGRLPERAGRIGGAMLDRLAAMRIARHVVDIRGVGALAAIEFGSVDAAMAVYRACCRAGLLLTPRRSIVRIAPPLTVSDSSVERAMDLLESALRDPA